MSGARNDDSGEAGARRGGAFYDDPRAFERYQQPQSAVSDPTFVMEESALLEEIGSVEGLRVVDLGCGDAAIGAVLLNAGFALTALRECPPQRERFDDEEEFIRRSRIPLFLLLAGLGLTTARAPRRRAAAAAVTCPRVHGGSPAGGAEGW